MGGLLHLVQRGGAWAGCGPAQSPPRCTNMTAHPSTASVPITILLYDGPLLFGFILAIKGLNSALAVCLKALALVLALMAEALALRFWR